MRISVLQQNPGDSYDYMFEAPELDFLKQKSAKTLDKCFCMIKAAAEQGANLVVTIETVNNLFALGDVRFSYPEVYEGIDGPTVKRFSETAKALKIHIVAGLLLTLDGKTYNCAVLFDDNGEIVGIHKKVHLPAGEEFNVAHGDSFEVFQTKLGNIGMLVCWDMQFPEAVRELALGGADLIACPTLGWENIYGLSRAYENGVTIAAAMAIWDGGYSGYCDPSCIVNNMGRVLSQGPRDREAIVTADVDVKKEPDLQYGSGRFYTSHSMRKTRFSQRRPQAYKLINEPLEATPLYKRYFGENK